MHDNFVSGICFCVRILYAHAAVSTHVHIFTFLMRNNYCVYFRIISISVPMSSSVFLHVSTCLLFLCASVILC